MKQEHEAVLRVFANPYYCISKVDEVFAQEHKPIVSERKFIKVGERLIGEIGARKYLKCLLANLKGDYVIADNCSDCEESKQNPVQPYCPYGYRCRI